VPAARDALQGVNETCNREAALTGDGYVDPAKALGDSPLTNGEEYVISYCDWLADPVRTPSEIRGGFVDMLFLLAWNDETNEGEGRSRIWRRFLHDVANP
jgi:hypothetical protein